MKKDLRDKVRVMKQKKMLKRILVMLLTASLTLSAAVTAFADADSEGGSGDAIPTESTGEISSEETIPEVPNIEKLDSEETVTEEPAPEEPAPEEPAPVEPEPEPYKINFDEAAYRTLTSRSVSGTSLGYELRGMANEAYGGYSVVQGGCTDGKYAYYMMVKKSNDMGKVLKVNLSNSREKYKSLFRLNISHGNGMAYDSKNHRLVVSGVEGRRTQLTFIDADTLRLQGYKEIDYSTALAQKWRVNYGGSRAGIVALSYISRYDCYVALQRKTYDLLVLDSNFRVIGFITTNLKAKYPGTYQAMDADEKYVYIVLSYYNDKQPCNRIIALDWNSENLLEFVNGRNTVCAGTWQCSNNKNGQADADIIVKTPHEAENLFHTTDANGRQTFYLSEYHRNPQYKWVKKKKAYKVKWKKVKKRVKVKGKWKKKKVWKYKTKYKKVKVKVLDYCNRKGYVYKLNGI